MKASNRKILEQNFNSFVCLLKEVHEIALSKPLSKISEGVGDDIAIKISLLTCIDISGKTLCNYTEAVLEKKWELINPQLPTLHCLAEYVIISKDPTAKKENRNYPYWIDYENKFINIKTVEAALELNKEINPKNKEETSRLTENLHETIFKEQNKKYHTAAIQKTEGEIIDKLTLSKSKSARNRRPIIMWSLLIFFVITIISYLTFQKASKEDIDINFTTSFKNIYTPKELLNTGWKVLDPDDNYISEGLKDLSGKGLQLFTLPGDYWITDTMKRFIKNTFVLAIPQGDFKAEVSLSMSDFNNVNCPHQQAGIILLNDTFNLANNVRFTVTRALPGTAPHFQEIYSKAKPEKNQWEQNLNEILSSKGFPDYPDSILDIKPEKLNEVALQVIKYHGHFIFRFKAGGDDRPFYPAFVDQFNFEPKFICLAAFQGQVNHREKLALCDNIPVTFSDFRISPNDKDDKVLLDNLLKKY